LRPITIDVVVPTIRLDTGKLSTILNMTIPDETTVHYYIIADRPDQDAPESFYSITDRKDVIVIRNGGTFGVQVARNIGFEAGSSEYVLFLDDDVDPCPELLVAYREAIEMHADSPGFVGVSEFPSPVNSFTRGTVASDILTFWNTAATHERLAWGVTANLLVRRDAVGDIRFLPLFPKRGGGEDIDYCLRIVKRTGKWFTASPKSLAVHQWWDNGSRQYRRFARYAYGDSRLPGLHPQYKHRTVPNVIETIVLGLCITFLLAAIGAVTGWQIVEWGGAVGLLEFTAETVRLKASRKISVLTCFEATVVRLSNDLGRILGNLRRGHLLGFTERFDYFATGESLLYERKVAVSKFLLFVTAGLISFMM